MPKFTVTLFDEGDSVKIGDGDFAGSTGTVVAWQHVSSAAKDVLHIVKLDTPVKKTVTKAVDLGGGRILQETEEVTFYNAEVVASQLS